MTATVWLKEHSGWIALGGLALTTFGFVYLLPRAIALDLSQAHEAAPAQPQSTGWPWLDLP